MTQATHTAPLVAPVDVSSAVSGSPADLAELIGSFNEVTGRLQAAHETLSAEVVRLQSELRRSNEQLRRSKQLAALGEMAAGIAHEVRNPLVSIGLYASMLREDLADQPEQAQIAVKIGDAVRGLDRVVGDVLCFSRDYHPRLESVEVKALLARAFDVCDPEFEAAGMRLRMLPAGADALSCVCDATLVHQALVNVLRNAREAMESSPMREPVAVTLGASERLVRSASGSQSLMVAIAVRDAGPGVGDDVMKRMFNPFFTTREAGTGLGLAIVHRIMDAHGGRVEVRNNENGGGATVELLLPVKQSQEQVRGSSSAMLTHGEVR